MRNRNNFDPETDIRKEVIPPETLTVPGEAYSIADLIRKSANGLQMDVIRDARWDDDDITHDEYDKRELANMDLAELAQVQLSNLERIEAIKSEMEEKTEQQARQNQINEQAIQDNSNQKNNASEEQKQSIS